jgi:oligosaccharide repeat unit polymerase
MIIIFILTVLYTFIHLSIYRYKKDKVTFLSLFVITFPFTLYFLLILIFQVQFKYFVPIFFFNLFFCTILSYAFCLIGISKATENFKNSRNDPDNYFFLYTLCLSLGVIACLANIIAAYENAINFITNFDIKELYRLRYSININESSLDISSPIEYLKIFLPFAFVSFIPIDASKKINILRYSCLFLLLLSGLLVAGRIYFLYAILMYLISTYFKQSQHQTNYKNYFLLLFFFYLLNLSFTYRSSDFDTYYFYLNIGGIESISFLGAEIEFIDKLLRPAYIVSTYYFQSANHVSDYLTNFRSDTLTLGAYQFALILKTVNYLFGTTFQNLQDFSFYDRTTSLFSTYGKLPLTDFGYLGTYVAAITYGYFLGYLSITKEKYWYWKIIYYFLLAQFILAPQLSIFTDWLLLLVIFILLIALFNNNFKKIK